MCMKNGKKTIFIIKKNKLAVHLKCYHDWVPFEQKDKKYAQ